MPERSKKALGTRGKKQQHVRFSTAKISTASQQDIRKNLARVSVSAGTNKTYTSALKTLSAFLVKVRGGVHPLESITQDEFIRFLQSCKDQNMSSTETYRSALAQYQLAHNVPQWARSVEILKLSKAVGHLHVATPKGVITPDQCRDLCQLIAVADAHFVPPCNLCWDSSPKTFNKTLMLRLKLQWTAILRPGELQTLRKKSLVQTLHHHNRSLRRDSLQAVREPLVVSQLVFTTKKNISANGLYTISNSAADIFAELTKDLLPEDYIVSRCADKHIGEAVRKGAEELKWSTSVLWCAHALRKSVLTELTKQILEPAEAFAAGIVSSTLHGFYATSL
jgi:hypothetical protein